MGPGSLPGTRGPSPVSVNVVVIVYVNNPSVVPPHLVSKEVVLENESRPFTGSDNYQVETMSEV